MLTYQIEECPGKTLYGQLYRHIRDDIISGKMKSGEALPSKRALAGHLGISVITVEHAYEQLQVEGYIVAKPRKGFFVENLNFPLSPRSIFDTETEIPVSVTAKNHEAGLKKDVRDQPEEERHQSEKPQHARLSAAPLIADFSSNQAPAEAFPFATWARISRRILSEKQEELMKNSPAGGTWELREAIAGYMKDYRGIQVSPRQIVIGAGTEYLYGLLIQLLGFDKIYAAENPGYQKVSMIFSSYRVSRRTVRLDSMGVIPGELEASGAQVLHVTPSHHFPTGITMPVSRRYELLQWAMNRDGRYIIEDDYDSEFRMTGHVLPALYAADREERVIYLNTFTKSLASTIRVSYMILPPRLTALYEQKMSFYSCTVSTFEQHTLAAFIREGHFERQISRVRNISRRKKDLLLKEIEKTRLKEIACVTGEQAGLHFLMNLRLDCPGDDFLAGLARKGVRLRSLSSYYDGSESYVPEGLQHGGDRKPDHTFVMNYASVDEKKIPEAAGILEQTALPFIDSCHRD